MSRSRKKRKVKPPADSRRTGPEKPPAPRVTRSGLVIVALCFVVGVGGGLFLRRLYVPSPSSAGLARDTPASADAKSSPARRDSAAEGGPISARAAPSDRPTSAASSGALRRAEQQFGVLFRQGYESFHQERYAEALERFQQAVHVAPHLAEGHYYLGQTYAKLMWHERAEQEYRASLERMSDLRPAEEQLCILLFERGNYPEAISRLQGMLQQNPRDAFALGELAINHLAMGDPEKAIPLLQQYNQVSGDQAWGIAHLGRAYDVQGDAARAKGYYRRALQIDPYFAIAHYWLGLLLGREGEREESQEAFARYDRLRSLLNTEHTLNMKLLQNANDVGTLVRLAKVRYQVGKRKEARLALERAHNLAPAHPDVVALRRQWAATP